MTTPTKRPARRDPPQEKSNIHLRMSKYTQAQVSALLPYHGTKTEIIVVAIERLYRERFGDAHALAQEPPA